MRLEVLQAECAEVSRFIDFWSEQYSYHLEHLYDDSCGRPLTEERVWNLYKWKNGSEKIAAQKRRAIENVYIRELSCLPSLCTLDDGQGYLATLKGGPIWGIFWLHCINPTLFPIFDQHTYRAMARIKSFSPVEIPSSRNGKISAYFERYVPFTKEFGDVDRRKLDKALVTYGAFLKKGLGRRLSANRSARAAQ